MSAAPTSTLPPTLHDWLGAHAEVLDHDASVAQQVLPQLASAGLVRAGVPANDGGDGRDIRAGIEAIAAVAEHSLTAAFVLWAQRAFAEYLLASPNAALRERWLAPVLDGREAGASGLSNAMKFLAGIESIQIQAVDSVGGWRIDGRLPWVTNLRRPAFVVAAMVGRGAGRPPAVVALGSDRRGLHRRPDLPLLALRGSNTAAIDIDGVEIDSAAIIHEDGPAFLRASRPGFLGLQCGMSIGLARASLATASGCRADRNILVPRIDATNAALRDATTALYDGLRSGAFVATAAPLFEIRIRLATIVQQAVQLELQASGGRAYLVEPPSGFGRRWREAAFVPVITPSITQLQAELQSHALAQAA